MARPRTDRARSWDGTQHAFEIDQVDRLKKSYARLFFAGIISFIVGMMPQLLGTWPGCRSFIGIIPQSLSYTVAPGLLKKCG
jgi:hypothetical protein